MASTADIFANHKNKMISMTKCKSDLVDLERQVF
jgi:hypothetical protein